MREHLRPLLPHFPLPLVSLRSYIILFLHYSLINLTVIPCARDSLHYPSTKSWVRAASASPASQTRTTSRVRLAFATTRSVSGPRTRTDSGRRRPAVSMLFIARRTTSSRSGWSSTVSTGRIFRKRPLRHSSSLARLGISLTLPLLKTHTNPTQRIVNPETRGQTAPSK